MTRFRPLYICLSFAVLALLSACSFSLAGDVTPPPGYQAPVFETPPTATVEPEAEAPVETEAQLTATVEADAEAPAETFMVTGSVVHGSGGQVPVGLPVTLSAFDQMDLIFTETTTTRRDGTFQLDDLDYVEGRIYFASVEYQGTTYSSNFAVAEAGGSVLDFPITIYEPTTDTSGLVVDRLHVFFEFPTADTVQIIQLFLVSNPTDENVVPFDSQTPSITFPLPEGASNLVFEEGVLGDRFVATEGGFGDTYALPPDTTAQVLFAYEMPYKNKLTLSQPLSFPVTAAIAFVLDGTVELESEVLTSAGIHEVENTVYQMFAGGFAAGDELSFTLRGRNPNRTGFLDLKLDAGFLVGLLAFVAVVAAAGLYLRRLGPEGEPEASRYSDDPEALMDAIIALDERYERGDLPETEYQRLRAELKSRLQAALAERS